VAELLNEVVYVLAIELLKLTDIVLLQLNTNELLACYQIQLVK